MVGSPPRNGEAGGSAVVHGPEAAAISREALARPQSGLEIPAIKCNSTQMSGHDTGEGVLATKPNDRKVPTSNER
jgi:hypothetical protein